MRNESGNTGFWLRGSFVGTLLWLLHTTTNKQTSNNLDRIQGKLACCLLLYHSHSLSAKRNVTTAHPFSVTISTSLISPPPERRVFSKKFIMASLVVVEASPVTSMVRDSSIFSSSGIPTVALRLNATVTKASSRECCSRCNTVVTTKMEESEDKFQCRNPVTVTMDLFWFSVTSAT